MTTAELKNAIKTADFNRCFVFCGDEEYLKRYYTKELRGAILDDSFAEFNHFVFEGEKLDFGRIYDAVASPPMMTEYKLVEWHLVNFNSMKESDLEKFLDLCRAIKDYPYCCVLFYVSAEQINLGNLPKRPSKLYTSLCEECEVVVFERSTDAQLISWIGRHIQHEGLATDQNVCRAILSLCGSSMDILSLEIDKVCAYAKANGEDFVSEAHVMRVCSDSLESDAFGLTNAILARNKADAYDSLLDMKRKKTEPTIVLGSIFKLYTDILTVASLKEDGLSQKDIAQTLKVHEYKVGLYMKYASASSLAAIERIITACRKIDVSTKSSFSNAYTAIERFIATFV